MKSSIRSINDFSSTPEVKIDGFDLHLESHGDHDLATVARCLDPVFTTRRRSRHLECSGQGQDLLELLRSEPETGIEQSQIVPPIRITRSSLSSNLAPVQ